MGSPEAEPGRQLTEAPQHNVTIGKPFAVSKFQVTFAEWDTCGARGDCILPIIDRGWGRGRQPVINVSWVDAQRYVAWLSKTTGKIYGYSLKRNTNTRRALVRRPSFRGEMP